MIATAPTAPSSLAELAETANREHELAMQSGRAMVEHAIRAGKALLEAHAACEPRRWTAWLAENFDGERTMANGYMRVAFYQDEVQLAGVSTYNQARRFLAGLPGPTPPHDPGYPEAVREQALHHLAEGKTSGQVAALLGVSRSAVRDWADPDYAERHRQRQRERREKARTEKPQRLTDDRTAALRKRNAGYQAGPQQLAVAFKHVVEARRAQDGLALGSALLDLAATAVAWSDHLEREAAA